MKRQTGSDTGIVILGAGLGPDGLPGPAILRRVARGVRLAQAHPEMPVIVSGGLLRGPKSEAAVMVRLLDQARIAPARVRAEDQSRSTFENILFLRDLMEPLGIARILLVTDSFHMPRALMTCWWLGVPVRGRPAWNPREEIGLWILAHLREAVAIPVYAWRLWRYRLRAARR